MGSPIYIVHDKTKYYLVVLASVFIAIAAYEWWKRDRYEAPPE